MAVPHKPKGKQVAVGRNAPVVQALQLTLGGYTFNVPSDPALAAAIPNLPLPQIIVATAIHVAHLDQTLGDLAIAARLVDVDALRASLVALAGLNPDAFATAEVELDAVEHMQEEIGRILEQRRQAFAAMREAAAAAGDVDTNEDGDRVSPGGIILPETEPEPQPFARERLGGASAACNTTDNPEDETP